MPTKISCQVCGADIEIPDDVLDGELVSCSSCGQKYQVTIQNGLIQLKLIKVEEEDWGE
ncbi:alpha-aminoadipate/glutamate carrier protein LysW [Vulcanisaeta souniana]|uniref:Lysine biosynthesis protein LysW n=1 Tax=Vulcanisaeta souniana JCM 11219 TaxID=1293586 RepID=A0A830EGM3_9CREN|nr:alpha-aminoadipate/glutamate carrier protein LysW [Vulcanisaeta souniana]BDR92328.1 lysine biosynthesis protein LysW [Vulcanisaeta souniana JCM 11219]GGI74749.1 lysine biosynthesis protein LysW [Vulcanisaeta souniana JCM 11219]